MGWQSILRVGISSPDGQYEVRRRPLRRMPSPSSVRVRVTVVAIADRVRGGWYGAKSLGFGWTLEVGVEVDADACTARRLLIPRGGKK